MNPFTWSDTVTSGFWAFLLDATCKSILLLALAWVALRGMRRHSAAARHLTLLSVVGGILVLPLLHWTLPRFELLPASWSMRALAPKPAGEATVHAAAVGTVSAQEPATQSTQSHTSATTQAAQKISAAASVRPSFSDTETSTLWLLGPLVWAIGALCALVPVAAGLLSLRRLQGKSRVEDAGPLSDTLQRLLASEGERREVQLLTSARRQMPMTWGFLRPKILLPAQALECPEHRQRVVLLHELAHIQRQDFATTLLTR
ncbi:MAG: M56 family metallopeptidase, partial [Verrucomicrobiota bacterium]